MTRKERLSKKLLEKFQNKTLHLEIERESYINVKIQLFRRELSFNETLNYIFEKIGRGSHDMTKLLDEIVVFKEKNKIKKISRMDKESIYELLEAEEEE